MPPAKGRFRINAQEALRVYGGLLGCSGLMILVWNRPSSLGKPSWSDVFGAMLVVTGCWAAALAQIGDPALLRRGLTWFAGAHFAIVVALELVLPDTARHAGFIAGLLSFFQVGLFWLMIEYLVRGEILGPSASHYEQQMREAGAQEERNRLARDLHDSIKQQIFAIQTAAATAQTRFDGDRAGSAAALEQIRDSARDAMTEMEVMMDNLRAVPLENTSLVEALKKQCEALGHRTGAQVDFQFGRLPPNGTMAPGAHQAIFRVAQEAFANIGRHARAGNVTVSLGSVHAPSFGANHDILELQIQDDGMGFDQSRSSGGMGIANMRARAGEFGGQFELTSTPGAGTRVVFSLRYMRRKPDTGDSPNVMGCVWFLVAGTTIFPMTLMALRDEAYRFGGIALVILIASAVFYRRASARASK